MTESPGLLSNGSASPLSSDSSISSPSAASTTPSTTTRSPGPSSMTSSSTTSLAEISTARPSRRTRGRASPMIASRSRVRLARTSWTMPIAVLTTMISPNRPSGTTGPITTMTAKSAPMIALKRVRTLARTISATERLARTGTSLVLPAAMRAATSAAVRPSSSPTADSCGRSTVATTTRLSRQWPTPRMLPPRMRSCRAPGSASGPLGLLPAAVHDARARTHGHAGDTPCFVPRGAPPGARVTISGRIRARRAPAAPPYAPRHMRPAISAPPYTPPQYTASAIHTTVINVAAIYVAVHVRIRAVCMRIMRTPPSHYSHRRPRQPARQFFRTTLTRHRWLVTARRLCWVCGGEARWSSGTWCLFWR